MSHFNINVVLRGMQLTLVGGTCHLPSLGMEYLTFTVFSAQSSTESQHLYYRSLPPGCYCCSRRTGHPASDFYSGGFLYSVTQQSCASAHICRFRLSVFECSYGSSPFLFLSKM
jgi:hypothetical protein